MPIIRAFFGLVLTVSLLAIGCNSDNFHKVYPVTGKVIVDGQPAVDCMVSLYRTFDDDHPRRVSPFGVTDDNGEFKINSYSVGDGAPPGEYIVTIEWKERSGILNQNLDGPDKLGGAYSNKEANKTKPGYLITVGKEPLNLPPFEIKLTPEQKQRMNQIKERAKQRKSGLLGEK